MAFKKTVGGIDPWSMPSDGTGFLGKKHRKWERRCYSKARRREEKLEIKREVNLA